MVGQRGTSGIEFVCACVRGWVCGCMWVWKGVSEIARREYISVNRNECVRLIEAVRTRDRAHLTAAVLLEYDTPIETAMTTAIIAIITERLYCSFLVTTFFLGSSLTPKMKRFTANSQKR